MRTEHQLEKDDGGIMFLELNPVRAQMVSRPEEYPWSSYGINTWGDNENLSY